MRLIEIALQLSHHVNESNTSQSDAGGSFGLEAEHASYRSFDTAMILFDGVVQVFNGADRVGPSILSQPALGITLHNGHSIGLTAADSNLLWPALLGQSLADKALGSLQVPVSAEQKLDVIAADGTVQIKPLTFDPHIGLIQFPFACDRTLLPIVALKQDGAEMQNPAVHRGMVHRYAALGLHFFKIA